MPKQSDIDFANEVLRQGLVSKEVIEECLGILKNLNDVGVDDALDGIMCLKGHLAESQVSQVWNQAFSREFDDDGEEVFTLEGLSAGAPPAEAPPAEAPPAEPPPAEAPPTEAPPAEPPPAEAPAAEVSAPETPEIVEPMEPLDAVEPVAAAPPPKKKMPDIPGFQVESKLELDSTGLNYLATPKGKSRKAIVHVLYPQVAGDQKIMGWLIKHGRKLAKLNHPSAAAFYPVQPFENRAFFAQEIPQGDPLPVVLEEGEFEEERALLLLEQVAEVLQHAEEIGAFHGRLTPKNIFALEDNLVEVRFFTSTDRERSLFLGPPESEDLSFISPE
ncbi:MAG: hypothetical protein ACYTFG_07300, partial [Planctomycetota bacterium]